MTHALSSRLVRVLLIPIDALIMCAAECLQSGIRLKDLMAFANNPANIEPERRESNIRGMSAHLSSVFQHRFQVRSDVCAHTLAYLILRGVH